MQLFGIDLLQLLGGIGALVIILAVLLVLLVAVGSVLVLVFWRAQKILLPRITLLIVSGLEMPIKKAIRLFRVNIDDKAFTNIDGARVDLMLVQLRNQINRTAFAKTPAAERAVFMPQCLRSPNCPARTSPEGIQCIKCGQCGLCQVKVEAEKLGCRFFIAPGGSLIKRMVKKYQPRAVLGVGCPLEVKEGTALMEAAGIPVYGVVLKRDGCVDTRIDVTELLDALYLGLEKQKDADYEARIQRINAYWKETAPTPEEKEAAKEQYFDAEVNVLHTGLWAGEAKKKE